MIPNGVRMAGTIPYRDRVKASWTPITTSPWWSTVNDTIDINSPADDYGFTPSAIGSVSGTPGDVTYALRIAAAYSFLGTSVFGGTGNLPMTFSSEFGMAWDGSGPFSGQDAVRIGLSTTRAVLGNDSYIVFAHDKAGINPPGENWQCMCQFDPTQPNAASFMADSGIPPTTTPQTLSFSISADGKTITWYIDGAQVATVTGDSTHIYFSPTGEPIVAVGSNASIYNNTYFNFSGEITIE